MASCPWASREGAVAYPAIAWLCWVPNLALAELWFNRPRGEARVDAEDSLEGTT